MRGKVIPIPRKDIRSIKDSGYAALGSRPRPKLRGDGRPWRAKCSKPASKEEIPFDATLPGRAFRAGRLTPPAALRVNACRVFRDGRARGTRPLILGGNHGRSRPDPVGIAARGSTHRVSPVAANFVNPIRCAASDPEYEQHR
jgi:hypothetical protein